MGGNRKESTSNNKETSHWDPYHTQWTNGQATFIPTEYYHITILNYFVYILVFSFLLNTPKIRFCINSEYHYLKLLANLWFRAKDLAILKAHRNPFAVSMDNVIEMERL